MGTGVFPSSPPSPPPPPPQRCLHIFFAGATFQLLIPADLSSNNFCQLTLSRLFARQLLCQKKGRHEHEHARGRIRTRVIDLLKVGTGCTCYSTGYACLTVLKVQFIFVLVWTLLNRVGLLQRGVEQMPRTTAVSTIRCSVRSTCFFVEETQ